MNASSLRQGGQTLAMAVVHRDLAGLHAEVELERAMAARLGAAVALRSLLLHGLVQ